MAILRKKVKKGDLRHKVGMQPLDANTVLKVASDNGLKLAPLDVRGLARALGVRLNIEPLDNDISGYLEERNGLWSIYVNSLHHPRRQRFTIAHELGHYFLHRGLQSKFVDKKLFRDGASNRMETEANSFAGELLMPESEFRKFLSSRSNKVEDIAEHFGVSAMAVQVRAEILGY